MTLLDKLSHYVHVDNECFQFSVCTFLSLISSYFISTVNSVVRGYSFDE